jgi:hypothetical protein
LGAFRGAIGVAGTLAVDFGGYIGLGFCSKSSPYFKNWAIVCFWREIHFFSCALNRFCFAISYFALSFASSYAFNAAVLKTLASPAFSPDLLPRNLVFF